MTGNGLVIAFTLIYLHQARGVALPVVGVLLAASAAGLLVVTVSGVLLDLLGTGYSRASCSVIGGLTPDPAAQQRVLAMLHR